MPTRNWNFDFADVEITEDQIIVNSTIDYKKFNKKYADELEETSFNAVEILKSVIQKKRVREENVKEPERTELIVFFDRLEGESSYEPGEAVRLPGAATTVRDTAARDIKYEEESLFKIHINEEVDLVLEHDGTVIQSDISGKIMIENKGESDRIWDIDVMLDDLDNTDLDDEKAEIHLPRLESGEEWDRSYKIKPEQVREPPLEITESINTWPDTDEENTTLLLEKEHEVEFTLILENNSDGMVLNIDLVKEFPNQFKNLEQVAADEGDVDLDKDKVEWKIEEFVLVLKSN
jgi:hypothetical protein